MAYLSHDEFWKRHAANRETPRYEALRRAKLEESGYACGKCRTNHRSEPWRLHVDHRYYRKGGRLIFGRETARDVRIRCEDCHTRGVDRVGRDWLLVLIEGAFDLVFVWPLRMLLRAISRAVRGWPPRPA